LCLLSQSEIEFCNSPRCVIWMKLPVMRHATQERFVIPLPCYFLSAGFGSAFRLYVLCCYMLCVKSALPHAARQKAFCLFSLPDSQLTTLHARALAFCSSISHVASSIMSVFPQGVLAFCVIRACGGQTSAFVYSALCNPNRWDYAACAQLGWREIKLISGILVWVSLLYFVRFLICITSINNIPFIWSHFVLQNSFGIPRTVIL
jgi:hypothetical protein